MHILCYCYDFIIYCVLVITCRYIYTFIVKTFFYGDERREKLILIVPQNSFFFRLTQEISLFYNFQSFIKNLRIINLEVFFFVKYGLFGCCVEAFVYTDSNENYRLQNNEECYKNNYSERLALN